jgi:hypothetical protein
MESVVAFGSLLKVGGHLRNPPLKKGNPPEAQRGDFRHTRPMLGIQRSGTIRAFTAQLRL